MKNHRFLWLRNRTTDNRKCEKARNIKEKRTIEMFNTVSKPPAALLSSASVDRVYCVLKRVSTETLFLRSNNKTRWFGRRVSTIIYIQIYPHNRAI